MCCFEILVCVDLFLAVLENSKKEDLSFPPPIRSTFVRQENKNVLMMFSSQVKTSDIRWNQLCPGIVTRAIEGMRIG